MNKTQLLNELADVLNEGVLSPNALKHVIKAAEELKKKVSPKSPMVKVVMEAHDYGDAKYIKREVEELNEYMDMCLGRIMELENSYLRALKRKEKRKPK